MTACERRILTTKFVSGAMNDIMSIDKERMRVGCFERSGCLITMLVNDEYDRKIKPQGMTIGKFKIPTVQVLIDGGDLPEGQNEEEATIIEEQIIIEEEHEEQEEELVIDEEVDNGDIIDDNPEDV